jgi:hypothetical protein
MPRFSELTINQGRPGVISDLVPNSAALAAYARFPGRDTDLSDCDIGKFVEQSDTGQVWRLKTISPRLWIPVSGAGIDPDSLNTAINNALGATLANYLKRDGTNAMAADLPLGGNKGVNGAAGTNPTDLVILSQVTGLTADDIGAAFAINSFALSGTGYASVKRRGDAISTVTATASYVRTPTSASIANSYGGSSNGSDVAGGSWSISTPFTSATMSGSVQRFGSSGGADPTWTSTLTAANKTTKTAAVSVVWTGDCYAGMVSAAPTNSAQVQALSSVLSQTTARVWTVSGTAQYFCSCYPASRGQAIYKFHSSGFGIPVATTTVSVTRNGATDLYNVDTSYNVFTLSSETIEVIL